MWVYAPQWKVLVDFNLHDCWVGCHWKRSGGPRIDIWICVIPCFPVHFIRL